MAVIRVNPNAEVSAEFPTFAPGAYRMVIKEVTDRNPEKNDLKIVLNYADPSELTKLDGTPYTGKAEGAGSLFDYVMLAEDKQWKLRQLAEAAGLAWNDFDPTIDLVGREVTVKVKIEEYNGEQRNKVGRYVK